MSSRQVANRRVGHAKHTLHVSKGLVRTVIHEVPCGMPDDLSKLLEVLHVRCLPLSNHHDAGCASSACMP
jgi:hypothetical protein